MSLHKNRLIFHRYLAGFALILAAFSATAQQPEAYRHVKAGELYAGIMEGGLASWVQDPAQRTMLSTAMATSYMLGVANSTQNTQWCPKDMVEVQVISGAVLDYLADLPENRHSENAATVVGEALGKRYPCP